MSALLAQARELSQRLSGTDAARRSAERDGDLDLRDMLGSATADLVREADPSTLRALVLMWMLSRTRVAELLDHPNLHTDPDVMRRLRHEITARPRREP